MLGETGLVVMQCYSMSSVSKSDAGVNKPVRTYLSTVSGIYYFEVGVFRMHVAVVEMYAAG